MKIHKKIRATRPFVAGPMAEAIRVMVVCPNGQKEIFWLKGSAVICIGWFNIHINTPDFQNGKPRKKG
ncbi:MAG: hypothetical protein HY547_08215 [Elusimicrobia bacterium]|nr:hypothetical protein [Elusimicrobiota bacterium]